MDDRGCGDGGHGVRGRLENRWQPCPTRDRASTSQQASRRRRARRACSASAPTSRRVRPAQQMAASKRGTKRTQTSPSVHRWLLDLLEDQKKKLEKDLAQAQARLEDAGPQKANTTCRPTTGRRSWPSRATFRIACRAPEKTNDFMPSSSTALNKLGLAPQDGPIIQQALQASNARAWAVVQPMQVGPGRRGGVQRLGIQACMSSSQQTESTKGTAMARRCAGSRNSSGPARGIPASDATSSPIERAYLALTSESQNIEHDLAQSLGPEDAKRIVFADEGCWWNSAHGVGPVARGSPGAAANLRSASTSTSGRCNEIGGVCRAFRLRASRRSSRPSRAPSTSYLSALRGEELRTCIGRSDGDGTPSHVDNALVVKARSTWSCPDRRMSGVATFHPFERRGQFRR